jgi:protein lysine acetyltransferase
MAASQQPGDRRIVAGVDGSPSSREALRWAVRQTALTGSIADAVIAWRDPASYAWLIAGICDRDLAAKTLGDTVHSPIPAGNAVTVRQRVIEGHAARALLDAAPGDNVLSDRDTIVADLERCDVLAAAERADLQSLAGFLTPFAACAGTVLLRRGDVAEHFLLLTSGRARVAFGERGAQKVTGVEQGSILGEMALLRGTRRSATVTAVTQTRGLKGGRAAFTRLLAIPGVLEKVVTTARQRLAADLVPVPVTLRDGTAAALRPIFPGDQYELLRGERLFSADTRYMRFFAAVDMTPALARYLAEVDYVDHFAWVAVDSAAVPVGGATYVRSVSDRALADISFLIEDEFQGRGLGTLLMGAVAIAARRNGISRFCADVLAENAPMRAILAHAGIKWQPAQAGVVHGHAAVPDPGQFGIMPDTAAALAAIVDEMNIHL